jgi:DNA-binding XRE family transcriptional regulator
MDMKINLNKLIDERNTRAWTQGHLAQVCGLSLRTIQRIEKTGVASQESIKALASVFEVSVEDLLYSENKNQNKTTAKFRHDNIGDILAKIGLLFLLAIPLIWLFTAVTGTNLMLVVSDIEGARKTISSSSTLMLLFGYTNINYFTLLPAITLFSLSIITFYNNHAWVKKALIISTIGFLLSAPIAGIIVTLIVMSLFMFSRQLNAN